MCVCVCGWGSPLVPLSSLPMLEQCGRAHHTPPPLLMPANSLSYNNTLLCFLLTGSPLPHRVTLTDSHLMSHVNHYTIHPSPYLINQLLLMTRICMPHPFIIAPRHLGRPALHNPLPAVTTALCLRIVTEAAPRRTTALLLLH